MFLFVSLSFVITLPAAGCRNYIYFLTWQLTTKQKSLFVSCSDEANKKNHPTVHKAFPLKKGLCSETVRAMYLHEGLQV